MPFDDPELAQSVPAELMMASPKVAAGAEDDGRAGIGRISSAHRSRGARSLVSGW
jgi:hypothetical protein